jgi:diazepam-binding inhibitor (GABA receptor modulating acyl-CoA-binding protein)
MLDFKGKAKWDAWSAKKGVSQDDAKLKYIEYANQMVTKHGTSS